MCRYIRDARAYAKQIINFSWSNIPCSHNSVFLLFLNFHPKYFYFGFNFYFGLIFIHSFNPFHATRKIFLIFSEGIERDQWFEIGKPAQSLKL